MNRHAWAIRLNHLDRPEALAGVYYFTLGRDIPSFLDGIRTALFRTREEARARCRMIHTGNLGRRPSVVKVRVTITEVPMLTAKPILPALAGAWQGILDAARWARDAWSIARRLR